MAWSWACTPASGVSRRVSPLVTSTMYSFQFSSLHVQQVVLQVAPKVVLDAAALVEGDGPGRVRIVQGAYPHVEHPVQGGQEADVLAVGAEPHRPAIRVAK